MPIFARKADFKSFKMSAVNLNREEMDVDFSYLEGTNCYCDPESAGIIRRKVAELPLNELHCIGTGDYHYLSLFFLERICGPFTLILADNHPDDQDCAFGDELLSCGSWVAQARRLPFCRGCVWIREYADIEALARVEGSIYLSIDLDVLAPEYAATNWDQGTMSLEQLLEICARAAGSHRLLGADICGGLSADKGGTEETEALNRSTIRALEDCLRTFLSKYGNND